MEPLAIAGPEITALYPKRLAQTWRMTEKRMRLTWTQDAIIGPPIAVNASGGDTPLVNFNTMAAPLSYKVHTQVLVSQQHLYGALHIGSGRAKSLEETAIGLNGTFKIDWGRLSSVTGSLYDLRVTGYGIDQYRNPDMDQKLLFDARGTGLAAQANTTGTFRQVRIDVNRDVSIEHYLVTLPRAELVVADDIKMEFYFRDLPLGEL